MKVTLKKREINRSGPLRYIQWIESLPFFRNPRGLLIHRVESVVTMIHASGRTHNGIHYLCNAQTTADGEFLAEPPANRLVCQACELAAKRKGKPSSEELVGRHVHVGKIRVERVCGCGEVN